MFSRRSNSKTYRSLKKSLTRKHSALKKLDPNPGLQLEALERRLLLSVDPIPNIEVAALGSFPWLGDPIGHNDALYAEVLAGVPWEDQTFQITNTGDEGSMLYIDWVEMLDNFSIQLENPWEPIDDYSLGEGESTTFTVQLDTSALDFHTGEVNIWSNDPDFQGEPDFPFTFWLDAFVNAEPIANAGGHRTVNEGEVVTFSGTYDDPNEREQDPLTFEWKIDGTSIATSQSTTHVFDDEGTYFVEFSVKDDFVEGADTDTITVEVVNLPPTVDAGGPYNVEEGFTGTFQLNGSANDPGDEEELTYAWDLNNNGFFGEDPYEPHGTVISNEWMDEVSWTDLQNLGLPSDGTDLIIRLQVRDDIAPPPPPPNTFETASSEISAGYDWATLRINNLKPTPDAGGNAFIGDDEIWGYKIDEGDNLALDASASSDPDDRDELNLTYSWDLDGDEDYEITADPNSMQNVPWSTLQDLVPPLITNGTPSIITLRVDDGEGGVETAEVPFVIENREPVAEPGGNAFIGEGESRKLVYSINEGEGLLLDGSGSADPGNDPLTYSWTIKCNNDIDTEEIVLAPWSFLEGLGVNNHTRG